METITINIPQSSVYEEVAKATDYIGSKLLSADDPGARDRILITDDDLAELGRFWDEAAMACNENFKPMLRGWSKTVRQEPGGIASNDKIPPESLVMAPGHSMTLEVSKSYDQGLTSSVQTTLRSYFISSIIGQWFKFVNREGASDYFEQAAEMLATAERMLYSRLRPEVPTD